MRVLVSLCVGMLGVFTSAADVIVQQGSVSGSGGPTAYPIDLVQFDEQGGARRLNFVQVEALTSIRGGYTIDSSGGMVDIFARLTADYSLDGQLLVATEALIDDRVNNNGQPRTVSVFDSDTQQTIISDPNEVAPWIGDGTVTMTALVEFVVSEDPAGVIGFSAGGSVNYTVTYDYDEVAVCPGDADGDSDVDITDLGLVLSEFGMSGAGLSGDVDGDGDVDITDLGLCLAHFGDSCA